MSHESSLPAQKRGWSSLKGLHPAAIDLQRVGLIRERPVERLAHRAGVEALLLELGLNDEGLHEFPEALHPHCGQGLRIWQYPIQFGPYLARLARLKVRSYLELGVRHGGSFVATVEFLDRFSPLQWAVGVDLIPCPSLVEYAKLNPKVEFVRENTLSPGFAALAGRLSPIDLVFIDSHHEESQCRRELDVLRDRCNMIAFHDLVNVDWPGVRAVWSEFKADATWECFEFTEQYGGLGGPYMGIGLAVRRARLEGEAG